MPIFFRRPYLRSLVIIVNLVVQCAAIHEVAGFYSFLKHSLPKHAPARPSLTILQHVGCTTTYTKTRKFRPANSFAIQVTGNHRPSATSSALARNWQMPVTNTSLHESEASTNEWPAKVQVEYTLLTMWAFLEQDSHSRRNAKVKLWAVFPSFHPLPLSS